MLAFLHVQDRGDLPHLHIHLEVHFFATFCGDIRVDAARQSDDIQSQEHRSAIPFRELDDPPDSSDDSLPSLKSGSSVTARHALFSLL